MEWFETEARRQIAETAERFARKELLNSFKDVLETKEPEIPWEAIRSAGQMGLLTGPLPEELGGIALDAVSEVVLWDRIATGMAGAATLMALHTAGLQVLADLQGEVPEVRTWIENHLLQEHSGRPCLLGLVIPEPVEDCPDPVAAALTRETGEQGCTLQGGFLCLPAPSAVSRMLVLVPEGDQDAVLFWAEGTAATSCFVPSYPGSGLEEIPWGRLRFADPTPLSGEILCKGNQASGLIQKVFTRLRLALAAVQTGNAEGALLEARAYARERVQTGRTIIEHQEVRKMLTQMETQVQACRSLVYRAGALAQDTSGSNRLEILAAQAHRFCDSTAESVCLDAVQVLGGYGYMKDYGVEKRLRDCKTLQALLGSCCTDWLGTG